MHPAGIDIWSAPLDGFTDDERAACAALLGPSERARFEAFKVESARTQFLAARGLLRTTLSLYRAVAPDRWRFRMNAYGRPFVDGVPGLHFSLSHTDGLVACAIAAFPEIGIDVERRDRTIDISEMRRGVLAEEEALQLETIEASLRGEAFFAFWTLKEAYVKARGMGLSLPLDSVRFAGAAASPRARFADGIADDPRRWTFWSFRPAPDHIAGLAAAAGTGEMPVSIRQARVINGG